MTRLLLRVFLVQFAIVLVAAVIASIASQQLQVEDARAYLVQLGKGPMAQITREFEQAPVEEWPGLSTRLTREYGYPIRLLNAADTAALLGGLAYGQMPRASNELAAGNVTGVFTGPLGYGERILQRIPGRDSVIAMGPVPDEPIGFPTVDVILVLGIALGLWLSLRPLARRLARLTQAAVSFGGGDLRARCRDSSRDALGKAAIAFNGMADALEQQFERQRTLHRSLAHELRTPLARLRFALELMGSRTGDRVRHEREANEAVDELETLVDELLVHARLEHGQWPVEREVLALQELAERTVATWAVIAPLSLRVEIDADVCVIGDARLLQRALANTLRNALRHARSRVVIRCSSGARQVCLLVDDDGSGIPAAERERVFEPFVRLDDARDRDRGGVGLGLAIARQALRAQGGDATVDSSPDGGARLRLCLPKP